MLAGSCKQRLKNDEICVLAESKLNTISDHVSKALEDHTITDDKFKLVLNEVRKYHELEAEIRARAAHAHDAVKLDEAEKKSA